MSEDKSAPISLVFKSAKSTGLSNLAPTGVASAVAGLLGDAKTIATFDSYSFERNLLAPGSPFRFTAPGIDADLRKSVRSGDMVQLIAKDTDGKQLVVATGFIDQTDTHISAGRVEYVLTGRDTLGQLIDNTVVDRRNKIIQTKNMTLLGIFQQLIANTRMPQLPIVQDIDLGLFLFQTNPGDTKMSTLQRYLEFANCLVWTKPNGQAVLGKPNMIQQPAGILVIGNVGQNLSPSATALANRFKLPTPVNILDARVRRDVNTAIRQIIVQLQNLSQGDNGSFTVNNQDQDVQSVAGSLAGRSVYDVFSYGTGNDAVNFVEHVGNFSGAPNVLGRAKALREIARENVKVLDVELTVQGHLNGLNQVYDVDQLYYVSIADDDVHELMYVYAVTHELTLDHGMTTKLRLCKCAGTLVAGVRQMPGQ